MATFKVEFKNKVNIDKKPRVYFTCHPDDFEKHFRTICNDIFKTHDCAIYYTEDMTEIITEDDKKVDLGRNNLFVIPITYKLLTTKNRALDEDIPYAIKEHIPVLPIMMESGLDELYSKPDKFGELQFLNPYSTDLTEISYEEKLKKYLESVLVSDEMARRIRAAFDAYIFLSYRKKDRKFANELMRLIHSYPECHDIAIWFDEFLTPGESFKETIEEILNSCDLFTLLITPRLLEKVIDENGEERDNYVLSTELPMARKKHEEKGTGIFAVEMETTDKEALSSIEIVDYISPNDEAFSSRLLDLVSKIAVTANDEPEHNFLIGLAYLEGIDVETNRERAVELIIGAAETDLPEAIFKLICMYTDGVGVLRNKEEAKTWSKRLAAYYFRSVFSKQSKIKSKRKLSELFEHYSDSYWSDTIKYFLLSVDEKIPFTTIEELYKLLMTFGICEYTLLFDSCKEMINYKEETQLLLVTDILDKSIRGDYPPYGPLFWYVPEYELYEVALLSLEQFKDSTALAKALALVRDVCFIFGRLYTADIISRRINAEALYNAALPALYGVRRALCELFYTGNTDYTGGADIYPRCFNVAETRSFSFYDFGEVIGTAITPFNDELGLYSHNAYNEVCDEYIGLISCPYDIPVIEDVLSKKSSRKICGLILNPSENTKMEYISFNRNHVRALFIPENIVDFSDDWNKNMALQYSITINNDYVKNSRLRYLGSHIILPYGLREIEDFMFCYGTSVKSVYIPETVVKIGQGAFKYCRGLTSIYIPDSVEEIGKDALYFCESLESLSIPSKVTNLDEFVFSGCSALTSLNLPKGITTIGKGAFSTCTGLTSVSIPDSVKVIGENAFGNCEGLTSITIPDSVTKLGVRAFCGCTKLKSIHLSENLRILSDTVFGRCVELTSIKIPDSVWKIEKSAFWKCIKLTSAYLPDNVLLGTDLFKECSSLTSVNIPKSVTTIPSKMFKDCISLSSFIIPDHVKSIEYMAFSGCRSLSTIIFPEGLKSIDYNAFANCPMLKSVSLPIHTTFPVQAFDYDVQIKHLGEDSSCVATDIVVPSGTIKIEPNKYSRRHDIRSVYISEGVTTISGSAFEGCINLTSIHIPRSVTQIYYSVFKGCRNLTSVNIPEGVTEIYGYVFSGCSSLQSMYIPEGVEKIGYYAFEKCAALASVQLPKSLKEIERCAFKECVELSSIYIPDSVTNIDVNAFEKCSGLVSVRLSKNLTEISRESFIRCESLTSIEIPEGITRIEGHAFEGCRNLASVVLPQSLVELESSVFSGCFGLETVNIPNSLTEIPDGTFYECNKLAYIHIPDGVKEFGISSFKGCRSLISINIPDGVETIRANAFLQCSQLESISIPPSVRVIGDDAFADCTSLSSITIGRRFEDDIKRIFGNIDPSIISFI